MWRLKLKETLERFTVLDCKNWTCGTPKNQQQQNSSSATVANNDNDNEKSTLDSANINDLFKCKRVDPFGPEVFLTCLKLKSCSGQRHRNSSSGSSHDDDKEQNYKKIKDNEYQLSDDILGAITWSGAVIFGWYASQILCTRRRHHVDSNLNDNRNKYIKYLYIPQRTIYSNINSHIVFTAPIQPEKSKPPKTIPDRVKYVEIPLLLGNKLTSSKSNNHIIQSQTQLNLQEITKSSKLEEDKIRTESLTNFAEYSTNENISSSYNSSQSTKTSQIYSDKEIKFLENERSILPKENINLTEFQQSLHHINNSEDSSDSSISSSTTSSTETEVYSTDDSSSSFIVFKDDTKEFSAPTKPKIYTQTNITVTDDIAPSTSSTTSSISKEQISNSNLTEAVSELVHHIADFAYKTAKSHIKKKDYKSALPHLKIASTHHHPHGIFNLGLCYEEGLGVRRNLEAAMECYQKASHLGHLKATFNLGVFYANGLGGLPKNIDLARKCIITAAKLGQPDAISFLKLMAVNDEEIAKYLKEQKIRNPSIDSGL